jgi:isoleucyl-tRNA synthetase
VQNLRKDSGFEVTDRIRIQHASSERLAKALNRLSEYVKQETLAVELQAVSDEHSQEHATKIEDINGEQSMIAVVRI